MAANILITGGSRGIGRATALLAGSSAYNFNIGLNYLRDSDAASSAVHEISQTGGHAVAIQGDTTHETDVENLFTTLSSHFPNTPLASVIINAGITAPALPLTDLPTARLRKVLDTNLLGSYLCARAAAQRLKLSPHGNRSIVFVGSVAARLGAPNEYVDYAGSKGGVDSLTVGLAKELGPFGVRVNCVRPGIIKTDIHALSGEKGRAERVGRLCPLGRPGEAKEVAEAIVWLVSEKASYVTGALLDVGGGR